MESLAETLLAAARWVSPALALWLLWRCVHSMLRGRSAPEIWACLESPDGAAEPVKHWESLIGRARSCDVVIPREGVERTHAALIRSDRGGWTLYDLTASGATAAGALRDEGSGLPVHDGDTLFFGGGSRVFHDTDEAMRAENERKRDVPGLRVSQGLTLLLLTVFQALLVLQFTAVLSGTELRRCAGLFAILALLQWACFFLMRALDRRGFEVETLAFFLTTLGLYVAAACAPGDLNRQLVFLFAGLLLFLALGWWLRDLRRTKALRWPLGALALALLALNLALGVRVNGAANWIRIGGFTMQPSEFVKAAYVYVGAASLDRLFRGRNLFGFIGFSAVCVGALALMGDFGTALIFFAAFLVISFLRSGSFATLFLAVAGAALAVFLILTVKPYIAQRFAAWGHVWDDPTGAGWQQTRALSAAASGGLTGVGVGRGWLHSIFAADTDLVFCLLCEELGLIVALCAVLALLSLAVFAFQSAGRGRSSYYVIAACASACMMLVQLSLNVFGSTDILPFTGVTFPFVSRGGSSMLSCWLLLAFIKAADTRQNASFSVPLSAKRRYAEYEEAGAEEEAEEEEAEE